MVTWDPEHPGCAPETCGGTRLDPCATIMRTRGRWHDGQVPETAAEAAATEWSRHLLGTPGREPNHCACRWLLDSRVEGWGERFRLHRGEVVVTAVADWLRAKEGARDNRAANLLDPGRPQ